MVLGDITGIEAVTEISRAARGGAIVCLAVVSLLAGGAARAQSISASLLGRVVTKSGTAVPAAIVQARSDASGATRTSSTDGDGRYRIDLLAPGTWSVVART